MATLDVSDAFDPSFISKIIVIKRKETINNKGRSVVEEEYFYDVDAVVTATSPSELRRIAEFDNQARAYTIYSQFRLQGARKDYITGFYYKNDIVIIDGDRYQIMSMLPYHNYGRGFTSVVAIAETGTPASVD